MLKDKGLVIGILVTIILIAGGVFFFSRGAGSSNTPTQPAVISQDILVSPDSAKTSGFVNGTYLPATESAKLTLVEFGDYQCPACRVYQPLVKQLMVDFAGKINFVFRNYPLAQHSNANISSQAAEAAGLQSKFWEMHNKIYEDQASWSDSKDAKNIFIRYAKELGLDVDKFANDMESSEIKDRIKEDMTDGNLTKLNATPTYFLNGVKMENVPPTYNELKSLIESELAK